MRKGFLTSAVVAAFMLANVIAASADGVTSTIQGLTPAEAAWELPPDGLSTAPGGPAADPGTIAYVRSSTHDIHVMAPDGSGDRVLWTAPRPLSVYGPLDLAWRGDGRELAFSSDHELACSWYESDVFAIRYDGTGYRRITNSPACAALATLSQGSVTVNVDNYTSTPIWVYVAGAPEVKWVNYSGTVTFDKVADFGPGVHQPAIGIYGMYRFAVYPPYADVQPGATVPGGNLTVMSLSGFKGFGAGQLSWKADGSALAYVLMSNSNIWQIAANPSYGATGEELTVGAHTSANLVAWGPTAATQNQYLYYSGANLLDEGYSGIYLNTQGDTSGGTRLVPFGDYDANSVYDIEWLPDGSGFLFSLFYVELGYFSNVFRYDFATKTTTQLTDFPHDTDYVHGMSISPDGQQVVFERVADILSAPASSLWIMNRDGSNLHKLADDAGHPAWARTPPPLTPRAYLPALVR